MNPVVDFLDLFQPWQQPLWVHFSGSVLFAWGFMPSSWIPYGINRKIFLKRVVVPVQTPKVSFVSPVWMKLPRLSLADLRSLPISRMRGTSLKIRLSVRFIYKRVKRETFHVSIPLVRMLVAVLLMSRTAPLTSALVTTVHSNWMVRSLKLVGPLTRVLVHSTNWMSKSTTITTFLCATWTTTLVSMTESRNNE